MRRQGRVTWIWRKMKTRVVKTPPGIQGVISERSCIGPMPGGGLPERSEAPHESADSLHLEAPREVHHHY